VIHTRLANRYEILGELGRGGMGVVYRARDPVLNREVAVKLVSSSDLTPELEERFQREAQVVGQMDHPAIVPIHDLGRHEGSLFFVMPVVSGTNLSRLLKEQTLTLGDVVEIGVQVADALDSATPAASYTATSSPPTSWSGGRKAAASGPASWTSDSPTRPRSRG